SCFVSLPAAYLHCPDNNPEPEQTRELSSRRVRVVRQPRVHQVCHAALSPFRIGRSLLTRSALSIRMTTFMCSDGISATSGAVGLSIHITVPAEVTVVTL